MKSPTSRSESTRLGEKELKLMDHISNHEQSESDDVQAPVSGSCLLSWPGKESPEASTSVPVPARSSLTLITCLGPKPRLHPVLTDHGLCSVCHIHCPPEMAFPREQPRPVTKSHEDNRVLWGPEVKVPVPGPHLERTDSPGAKPTQRVVGKSHRGTTGCSHQNCCFS